MPQLSLRRGAQGLAKACGTHCPDAVLNIISNPVNSTVPIVAETLKGMGVYDKNKVMGVTTLDVVRARTFYAEKTGMEVKARLHTPFLCSDAIRKGVAGCPAAGMEMYVPPCRYRRCSAGRMERRCETARAVRNVSRPLRRTSTCR